MKVYTVVITEHAEFQLESAVRYITVELDAPEAALRLYRRVKAKVASLSRLPARHRMFYQSYRRLNVDNYAVIYRIEGDVVVVDSILHGSSDIRSHLLL